MAIKKFETLDGINSNGAVVFANTLTVAGDLVVDTDTLYVDVSANNVGVNTTPSSAYALDVSGAVRATSFYGDGSNITGVTATNATTLNSLSSDKFLRSDVSDAYESGQTLTVSNSSTIAVTLGSVRFNDGQRLNFGTGNDAQMYWDNPNLTLKIEGADFNVSNTLYVDVSANNVGVNATPSSLYALDVGGSLRATSFVGNGSQLTGITATSATTANNSNFLGGVSSSQFLRSDATDTHTSGTLIINSSGLRVNDNVNLNLGTGSDFTFNFDGTKVNAGGADLAIDTNTLYVDVSANRVGIGKTNPSTTLDVSGSVTATTYYGDGSNLTGISGGSSDASTLDGIDSSGFLRSNTSDVHTNGQLIFGSTISTDSDGARFNDDIPLRFGTGSDVQIKYASIGSSLNVTGSVLGINISAGPVIATANVTAANFDTAGSVTAQSVDIGTSLDNRTLSVVGSTGSKRLQCDGNFQATGSIRAGQGLSTIVDNNQYGFTFINDADTGMFNTSSSQASGTLTFKANNEEKLIISQPTNTITANVNELQINGQIDLDGCIVARQTVQTVPGVYTSENQLTISTDHNFSIAKTVSAARLAGNTAVLTQNGTEGGELKFLDKNNSQAARLDIDTNGNLRVLADNDYSIYASSGSDILTTYATDSIQFFANVTVYGTVTEISDERLKSNIQTLDGSKVHQMRGVSYTMDGNVCSGVVAQELQLVAPELITNVSKPILDSNNNITGKESYLGVDYGHLVGYLIEAIKDLKSEIDELKNQ